MLGSSLNVGGHHATMVKLQSGLNVVGGHYGGLVTNPVIPVTALSPAPGGAFFKLLTVKNRVGKQAGKWTLTLHFDSTLFTDVLKGSQQVVMKVLQDRKL